MGSNANLENTFWFNEINFTSDIPLYLLYACCNQEIEEDEEEKELEEEEEVIIIDSSDVDIEEEEDEEEDYETESRGVNLGQIKAVGVEEFDNRVSV